MARGPTEPQMCGKSAALIEIEDEHESLDTERAGSLAHCSRLDLVPVETSLRSRSLPPCRGDRERDDRMARRRPPRTDGPTKPQNRLGRAAERGQARPCANAPAYARNSYAAPAGPMSTSRYATRPRARNTSKSVRTLVNVSARRRSPSSSTPSSVSISIASSRMLIESTISASMSLVSRSTGCPRSSKNVRSRRSSAPRTRGTLATRWTWCRGVVSAGARQVARGAATAGTHSAACPPSSTSAERGTAWISSIQMS